MNLVADDVRSRTIANSQTIRLLSMNLTQKAGASSTHSKRSRADSTFQ